MAKVLLFVPSLGAPAFPAVFRMKVGASSSWQCVMEQEQLCL